MLMSAFRPEPSIPAQTIIFGLRDSGLLHHSPQFDRHVKITSAGCSTMVALVIGLILFGGKSY